MVLEVESEVAKEIRGIDKGVEMNRKSEDEKGWTRILKSDENSEVGRENSEVGRENASMDEKLKTPPRDITAIN